MGLMALSSCRAAAGHAGVHALPKIQASLHHRMPPIRKAMPWRRGLCCVCLPWGRGDLRAEGWGFCSADRKEMLEESHPPMIPRESVSTTHQDYHAGGYEFTPLPAATQVQAEDNPSHLVVAHREPARLPCAPWPCHLPCPLSHCFQLQPHDYCTEQPCSFWLEQAHSLPVSSPSTLPCQHRKESAADRDPLLLSPPGCHQDL